MFLRERVSAEVVMQGMKNALVKTASAPQTKGQEALILLSQAAEIFDMVGKHAEADEVTSMLVRVASSISKTEGKRASAKKKALKSLARTIARISSFGKKIVTASIGDIAMKTAMASKLVKVAGDGLDRSILGLVPEGEYDISGEPTLEQLTKDIDSAEQEIELRLALGENVERLKTELETIKSLVANLSNEDEFDAEKFQMIDESMKNLLGELASDITEESAFDEYDFEDDGDMSFEDEHDFVELAG